MNLTDEVISELHAKVTLGRVTPKQLARMTSHEMSSSKLNKLREKYYYEYQNIAMPEELRNRSNGQMVPLESPDTMAYCTI
ncbi:hypothetical protein ACTXT7_006348 [Hymenolepis weldensis]